MRYSALLSVVVTLLAGCGYTLELSKLDNNADEPDPITLIRRDIRQLKADHRVAIFDLQKKYKEVAARVGDDLHTEMTSLRMRDADFGEQISEIEFQLRLMKGSIEEDVNRVKEVSEQKNNNALRELEDISRLMAKQEKNEKLANQTLQDQIALQTREGAKKNQSLQDQIARQTKEAAKNNQSLQDQIDSIQIASIALQKSSNDQIKALNEVSAQVSQLIDKVLPVVNDLAQRLDTQENQLRQMDRDINIDGLNRQLKDVREAIDVQRQSLEMLGNTLTAQVDKQAKLFQKTVSRLNVIEAKLSSKRESNSQ